eukprot:Platyproteum_vivax@DN7251_c0_g1_i3.p1
MGYLTIQSRCSSKKWLNPQVVGLTKKLELRNLARREEVDSIQLQSSVLYHKHDEMTADSSMQSKWPYVVSQVSKTKLTAHYGKFLLGFLKTNFFGHDNVEQYVVKSTNCVQFFVTNYAGYVFEFFFSTTADVFKEAETRLFMKPDSINLFRLVTDPLNLWCLNTANTYKSAADLEAFFLKVHKAATGAESQILNNWAKPIAEEIQHLIAVKKLSSHPDSLLLSYPRVVGSDTSLNFFKPPFLAKILKAPTQTEYSDGLGLHSQIPFDANSPSREPIGALASRQASQVSNFATQRKNVQMQPIMRIKPGASGVKIQGVNGILAEQSPSVASQPPPQVLVQAPVGVHQIPVMGTNQIPVMQTAAGANRIPPRGAPPLQMQPYHTHAPMLQTQPSAPSQIVPSFGTPPLQTSPDPAVFEVPQKETAYSFDDESDSPHIHKAMPHRHPAYDSLPRKKKGDDDGAHGTTLAMLVSLLVLVFM